METEIVAARWSLGYLGSEQLPQIALAWLEAGMDSPTMRVLAGEPEPVMSEVGPIFEQMLAELNIQVPSQSVAAVRLARRAAQEISNGTKSPYVGAREIWMLSLDCQEANIPIIFTGLASEYEDFADYQHRKYYGEEHCNRVLKEIETQIIEEADKLSTS
jgi:hypothetical protein